MVHALSLMPVLRGGMSSAGSGGSGSGSGASSGGSTSTVPFDGARSFALKRLHAILMDALTNGLPVTVVVRIVAEYAISPPGVTTVAGCGRKGRNYLSGLQAKFVNPVACAVWHNPLTEDNRAGLLVCDDGNDQIRWIDFIQPTMGKEGVGKEEEAKIWPILGGGSAAVRGRNENARARHPEDVLVHPTYPNRFLYTEVWSNRVRMATVSRPSSSCQPSAPPLPRFPPRRPRPVMMKDWSRREHAAPHPPTQHHLARREWERVHRHWISRHIKIETVAAPGRFGEGGGPDHPKGICLPSGGQIPGGRYLYVCSEQANAIHRFDLVDRAQPSKAYRPQPKPSTSIAAPDSKQRSDALPHPSQFLRPMKICVIDPDGSADTAVITAGGNSLWTLKLDTGMCDWIPSSKQQQQQQQRQHAAEHHRKSDMLFC